MTVAEQIHLLLHLLRDEDGEPYSAHQLAQAIDLSPQAVLNLITGDSTNPRLDTLRRLCRFFGISLDYFGLESAAACEGYLKRVVLTRSTPTIQAIASASDSLSTRAADNVLVMLSWAERAADPSGIHDERKHDERR